MKFATALPRTPLVGARDPLATRRWRSVTGLLCVALCITSPQRAQGETGAWRSDLLPIVGASNPPDRDSNRSDTLRESAGRGGAPPVQPAGTDTCIGDCGDMNTVGIGDLVTLVNIALGTGSLGACEAGDRNGDGAISVDEIITAVINALVGCPAPSATQRCLVASGGAATSCISRSVAALSACRNGADATCETALRAPEGVLAELLAATEEPVRNSCTAEVADKLTFLLGIDDLVSRTAQACRKWTEDFLAVTYAADLAGLPPEALACQRVVGAELAHLFDAVAQAYGDDCYVPEAGGQPCAVLLRAKVVGNARAAATQAIAEGCGSAFDMLGVVELAANPTLTGRIEVLTDVIISRAYHLAQRVYLPLNLGRTGLFGRFPVGVRTFELVDPSRANADGTGPRPVKFELYYPSTPEAVAGMARDVARVFGNDLFATPTYRDAARAPSRLPLLLFSPGQGSDPWQYVYLGAHLASHGFLVASVEHHGDHLLDGNDTSPVVNRPRDLSFVLDRLLALNAEPDSFLANAIDAGRIGAAGHSRGGTAALALATCPVSTDALSDPRIKAVLSLDGAAGADHYPGIFSTVAIPTLLVGGTLSYVTPVVRPAFDALTPGPAVMGFADLVDARHGTFSDACEIPDAIAEAFNGGPVSECGPESLYWRYARHLTNYLALNFFDATLNDNSAALARLDPMVLGRIEEIDYQSKDCPPGESCRAACTLPCGDGVVALSEACDTPGRQGTCAVGDLCNDNCTACVNCEGATVIDADGGVLAGTTVGGRFGFHSTCSSDLLSPAQLFQWTPSVSHVATIETCGGTTNFDTTVFVREGTCLGPDLACNDDGGDATCGVHSRTTLPVVAGTPYFIVVDGFLAASGEFTLSVR